MKEIKMSSLYDNLGGEKAVDAAVEIFYKKVLSDDRIKEFFNDTDMDEQIEKQKAFLTYAFGGPNKYTGKTMRAAHAHLLSRGLDDSHVDAVIENLGGTLKELGVADEHILEVAKIAESVRGQVLGQE